MKRIVNTLTMAASTVLLVLQLSSPMAQAHHRKCDTGLRCMPSLAAQMQVENRQPKAHKTIGHSRIRQALRHAYGHGYRDGYRAGMQGYHKHHQMRKHGHLHRKWVRLPRGHSYNWGQY